jgi:hypothetical protein
MPQLCPGSDLRLLLCCVVVPRGKMMTQHAVSLASGRACSAVLDRFHLNPLQLLLHTNVCIERNCTVTLSSLVKHGHSPLFILFVVLLHCLMHHGWGRLAAT